MAPVAVAARSVPVRSASSSRMPILGLRQAALNALFPFLVDTWLIEQRGFFRQLHQLIRGGIPLHQALGSMQQTSRSLRLRLPLLDALATVAEGGKLTEAFSRYPETFSEIQLELLRAGEEGGFLERVLEAVTVQIEKELELRRLLSRQTAYTKFVIFMIFVGIPLMMSILSGGNPFGLLLNITFEVLQLALMFAIVFSMGRTILMRSPQAREAYELAKWRVPGIGPVSRTYALARFANSLSCLYRCGVHLSTALRIAGRASGSYRVGLAAENSAVAAENGQPIVPPLRACGFIPEKYLNLLETGSTTGELDGMTAKMADYLEADADDRALKSAYIFSTIAFLIVALYVANTVVGGWIGILRPWRG